MGISGSTGSSIFSETLWLTGKGLLPLLKSIQKPCNLQKFKGQTIGVDAYGWLHRGTVACAIELALGKPTRKHIEFCMHRVRMLIHFGVVPYIVFDGDYLPSKAKTEADRAKRRAESKQKGLDLYRLNKPSQAHLELQKAIDVGPEMARQLIDELKKISVDYVVAPYEADAQLVYLERKGITQGTLSEDSDLLVFGAKRLLTKLDQYGDCVEINRADFTSCREISLVGWSDDEFRRMAILSGCDYLASIGKMGLKSSYRLVRKYKTIEKVVQILQFDGKYHVPKGYLEAFHRAELTFLHQRVFCPLANDTVMMTEMRGPAPPDMTFIGEKIERSLAMGVAKGDLDPMTKAPIFIHNKGAVATPRPASSSTRMSLGVETLSNMKENMSIKSFFESKARRTPLAELDVNTFTPSPTQQQILRQNSDASWDSSPAVSGSPLFRMSATTHANNPLPNPSSARRSVSMINEDLPKKRCLGSDIAGTDSLEQSEDTHPTISKFFAHNNAGAPSRVTGRTKNRRIKSDFAIWSDDSVEDIMAELAKEPMTSEWPKDAESLPTGDEPTALRPSLITENNVLTSDVCERNLPGKVSFSGGKASSDSCEHDDGHESLQPSIPTGPLKEAWRPDRILSFDWIAQKNTTPAHRAKTNPNDHATMEANVSPPTPEDPGEVTSSQTIQQNLQKPPNPRQTSLSALQRLGASALSRSKSYSGSVAKSTPKDGQSEAFSSEMHQNSSTSPGMPLAHSFGPDATKNKGSEDAMIPDSEEEGSEDISEAEEAPPSKPPVDFTRFAYNGAV